MHHLLQSTPNSHRNNDGKLFDIDIDLASEQASICYPSPVVIRVGGVIV